MKRVMLSLVGLCLGLTLMATESNPTSGIVIKGQVTDATGTPLVGAVVVINNTMLGTSTGTDGRYKLEVRRPGEYTLKASFLGYKEEITAVSVVTSSDVNFTLPNESILAEAVVVTSTRASSRMPIAQTTINAEKIRESKTGFDIPFLLETVPSIVAVSEGGTGVGNTTFRIRGTDMSRINVTVNGIPLNDPESQGVYWVNMPDFVSSVDNVQIQRGVGTSTNGAGAFGATVNFQTSTLTPEPFAQSELMAGSFGTYKASIKAGTGLINKRFSFETRYSKLKSEGYIDRGWSDHQSLFVTGAWHSEKSLLRVNLLHGDQHTGITWEGTPSSMLGENRRYNPAGYMGEDANGRPEYYPNESDNYVQNHYHLIFSHQLSRTLSINLAGFLISGEGFYEQFKGDRKLKDYGIAPIVIGEQTISRVDLVRQKWLDNSLYGTTYSASYRQGNLNLTLGGGLNLFDNDHFGKVLWTSYNTGIPKDFEWYRNNGKKSDLNSYLKGIYQVDKLSVFGDLQHRTIKYSLTGNDDDLAPLDQDHKWRFLNPKGGLFYNISSSQEAFMSVGIAHREPSRADIKDAMKYGSNHTPKHERLIDYEAGYTLKAEAFALSLNLFYMDYKDQLVLTGKLSEVGYPLMTNVKRSYRAGVELTGKIIPFSRLSWDANITLSKNRINEFVEYVDLYDENWEFVGQQANTLGSTDISFSPSMVASSVVRFTPFRNAGISLITKYVGKQYIDNTSSPDRMLDAYLVNNLKLDYRLELKNTRGLNLQLMVNNLLNQKYVANGWVWRAAFTDGSPEYREDGFFPQAGINMMVRVLMEI